MKKKMILTVAFAALLAFSPLTAFAENIDQKIEQQNQKIESIVKNEQDAKNYLAKLEEEISQIESDYQKTLSEKVKNEKELAELNLRIEALKTKIEKRNDQLESQARETQTSQDQSSILAVMLSSESISDAISKAIAVNTLVSANNDILQAQKADKEELDQAKISLTKKVEIITKKTQELEQKEQELAEAKLDQNVKINEISAALATETAEKDKFVKQKEDAEKKKQAELKAIAEAKKKQEALEAQALKEQQELDQIVKDAETAFNQNPTPAPSGGSGSNSGNNSGTTPTVPSNGWLSPLSIGLVVTSPFGPRQDPTGMSGSYHDGIDFAGPSGSPIMASKSGQVVAAEFQSSAGNHVIIKHDNGYYSYYLHLSSTYVSVGQNVAAGEVLGGMGTTGNSTGVHLHFGIATGLWSGFVNPAPFLGI